MRMDNPADFNTTDRLGVHIAGHAHHPRVPPLQLLERQAGMHLLPRVRPAQEELLEPQRVVAGRRLVDDDGRELSTDSPERDCVDSTRRATTARCDAERTAQRQKLLVERGTGLAYLGELVLVRNVSLLGLGPFLLRGREQALKVVDGALLVFDLGVW